MIKITTIYLASIMYPKDFHLKLKVIDICVGFQSDKVNGSQVETEICHTP